MVKNSRIDPRALKDTHKTASDLLSSQTSDMIERSLKEMDCDTSSVIYADIDHFRAINSALGYQGGDHLLGVLSAIIAEHFDDHIMIGRFGSGFFIISAITDEDVIEDRCNSVNLALAQRSINDDIGIFITISFGVSWHNYNEDPAVALSEAEDNCRKVKEIGGGGVHILKKVLHGKNPLADKMSILRATNQAMKENRLLLYTQPIVPVANDRLEERQEVLIRMIDEEGEIVGPYTFLPIAERYGLITQIDRWVISQIVDHVMANDELNGPGSYYSINLSGKTLSDPSFLQFTLSELERSGAAQRIGFEITETSLIKRMDIAKKFVDEVSKYGCKVALDDFGSGLCSFGYLREIPVDYVKIDGSFIRNISKKPSDYAMVKAITEIGHALGKKVVGEFVTDDETLQMLKEIGVDYAQGYYTGKPKPAFNIPKDNKVVDIKLSM